MSAPPLVYHTVQFHGKKQTNKKKTCSTSPRNKVGKIAISYKLQENGRSVRFFLICSRSEQFRCERGLAGRHSMTSQALPALLPETRTFTTMAPAQPPNPPARPEERTFLRTNCPHGVTEVEQLYQKRLSSRFRKLSWPSA